MEGADVDVDVDEDVVEEERARLRRVRRVGKGAHVENPEPPILLLIGEHLTRSDNDGVFEMREVSKRGVKHGRHIGRGIGKKDESERWRMLLLAGQGLGTFSEARGGTRTRRGGCGEVRLSSPPMGRESPPTWLDYRRATGGFGWRGSEGEGPGAWVC